MRLKRLNPRLIQRNVMKAGVLSLSFAIIAGCTAMEVLTPARNTAEQDQSSTVAAVMKAVKVAVITKQKIGDPIELTAEVASSSQIEVSTKTNGDVEQIIKKRGELVQEGEIIFRLQSIDARVQREKAFLSVRSAQQAQEKAKRDQEQTRRELENSRLELSNSIKKSEQALEDLTRSTNKTRNDYDKGLATKTQLDQAQTQLKNLRMDLDLLKQKQKTMVTPSFAPVSDIELKNAEIELQLADKTLEYLEVKAPASGVLTESRIETGMSLPAGSSVGLIQKLDPIKIKANLSEEIVKFARGKNELTYFVPGNSQKFTGKISYLASVIDPQTKAYELNLEVPNKEAALKPGMKVRIQLTNEQEQIVTAIPTQSIIKEGEDAFVFVQVGDTAEKRKVQLGRLNEPLQEVLSGVKEGESLIVSGQNQLKDKEKIQLPPSDGQK